MTSIKIIKKNVNSEAEKILSNGMSKISDLQNTLDTHFGTVKPSEMESSYEVSIATDPGQVNVPLNMAAKAFNDAIFSSIQDIQILDRCISLNVPQMEDGNNFGVTVQLTISKYLQQTKDELHKKMDLVPSYYASRADAVEKMSLPNTTLSETKTSSNSDAKGGKDGDEKKSSSSNVSEEKTTRSDGKGCAEYRKLHVVTLDVQFYYKLKTGLIECIDSYLYMLDNFEKNKEKLLSPKGSSGGRNAMSMY